MELITDWARQIAAYLILESVLSNLIRKKSYQKYVRLVMGLILIFLLIAPMLKVLKQSENYQFHLSRYLLTEEAADGAFLEEINEKKDALVLLEVEKAVKKRITEIAEWYSLELRNIELEFNSETAEYGRLEKIYLVMEFDTEVYTTYGTDSPDAIRLRERLAEEFGTEKSNIVIVIH